MLRALCQAVIEWMLILSVLRSSIDTLHIFLVIFLTALLECISHLLLCLLFLKTRGVVLPAGIPYLMQQGNPHLDHNDRSSPTGSLELECPFLKPCMGYYDCVCVPARLAADSHATVPCPRYSPDAPPVSIHRELLQATGFAIFTWDGTVEGCRGGVSLFIFVQ